MTAVDGFLLAVAAGWLVRSTRRATIVVLAPWLAVLAFQTWHIASGLGVSPPTAVTRFPDAIGYCIVQLVILALAIGIARQLSTLRTAGGTSTGFANLRRQTVVATVTGIALSGIIVAGFLLEPALFDPGSVTRHNTEGHPPVIGLLSIVLSVIVFAALSAVTLRQRASKARTSQGVR